jgi:uncharacterized repeat protein (TIGR01451 family)
MPRHPRLTVAVLGLLAGAALLPLAAAGPFRMPVKTAQLTKQQTVEPPLPGQQQPPPPPPFPGQPPFQTQPPLQPAPFQTQPPLQPAPPLPGPNVPLPGPGCPGVPCPVPACPCDPPPPVVTIKVRVADCSPAGQEIEYQIRVENVSAAPAHHVLVRNPLPANARFVRALPVPTAIDPELMWALGTLPPGCCRNICLVLAPTDCADITNCARVQFEHGQCVVTRIARGFQPVEPPPIVKETPSVPKEPPKVTPMEPPIVEPKEPPKVITPGDSKLAVKITGPAKQYANLPVKYHITVRNNGPTTAANVLIAASLPEGSIFVEADEKGRFHFNQVAWLIGDLPAGSSRTVQLVYKVPAAGEFCLKAVALPEGGTRGEDSFCTRFEGVSALLMEVVDSQDPVGVGGKMSYKITLLNQGSAPLTNIRIKATVPPELAVLRTSGPTDPGAKLPEPTAEGQAIVFPPLVELKAGERQVYEVFATAVRPGDARFRVVLTADELQKGGPVVEEESTRVFSDP